MAEPQPDVAEAEATPVGGGLSATTTAEAPANAAKQAADDMGAAHAADDAASSTVESTDCGNTNLPTAANKSQPRPTSTSSLGGIISDFQTTTTSSSNSNELVIPGIVTSAAERAVANPSLSTSTTASVAASDGTVISSNNNNNNNNTVAATASSGPSFSMTLAISAAETRRVVEASRLFNLELDRLRRTDGVGGQKSGGKVEGEIGEKTGKRSITGDTEGTSSSTITSSQTTNLATLLHTSALNTSPHNQLISTFLTKLTSSKQLRGWEVDTTLLFFLDADKSVKLLVAFDLLSGAEKKLGGNNDEDVAVTMEGDEGLQEGENDIKTPSKQNQQPQQQQSPKPLKDFNQELADRMIREDATSTKLVGRKGLVQLFQSFLSSISTCIHGEDVGESSGGDCDGGKAGSGEGVDGQAAATCATHNKSPLANSTSNDNNDAMDCDNNNFGDWKGSERTYKEIMDIATFAANDLMEFAKKDMAASCGGEGNTAASQEDPLVSFDVFGKWYNAGGFSLVPWLELLDLTKWDHHGSTNSAASGSHHSSGSSYKRARTNESFTPGFPAAGADEMIGSPTALFAAGAAVGATPQTSERKQPMGSSPPYQGPQSFSAMFGEMNDSRKVVSFEFANNMGIGATTNSRPFHIDISEENLVMLRNLVHRTGIASLTPQQVEEVMMRHSRLEKRKHGDSIYVIDRNQFNKFIREIVPQEASGKFDQTEIQNFSNYFSSIFTCFDYNWSDLKKEEVNAKELMVGFSFLCAGNKSNKLSAGYEMLDVEKVGYLTQRGLMQYLRSYLTMLAGISLLSSSKKITTQIRKKLMSQKRHDAFLAVENGAKWTLGNFLRAFEQEHVQQMGSTRSNAVTFEDFAKWYTEGGYSVAPWLELLDLNKFLSLIGESGRAVPNAPIAEVLFTFPLANSRSLVVLRDDAHYVRAVVAELGLLTLTSDEIWTPLYDSISSALLKKTAKTRRRMSMEVDQATFVHCLMCILSRQQKPKHKSAWDNFSPEETLKNFFLSFDLLQTNRVPLNQLMCGLTLLCGGKKSNKLVFAFGLFGGDDAGKNGRNLFGGDDSGKNGRNKSSMGQTDFFFFFRSFLIVMFSCCNQSLDLSGEAVSQYISDTAKSVAEDVMRYWRAKRVDRVHFDHFSEWYNEGGFETAPWLELLDLNKWVLADHSAAAQPPPPIPTQSVTRAVPPTPAPPVQMATSRTPAAHRTPGMIDTPASFNPSPNPEAFRALLASPRQPFALGTPAAPDDLLDFDMSAVDAEVDDMDFMLQHEHDTAMSGDGANAAFFDPDASSNNNINPSPPKVDHQNALKFHLLTNDNHRGYMISIGPNQVGLLNRIVTENGLCQSDAPTICEFILNETRSKARRLTKKSFKAAMQKVMAHSAKGLSSPPSSSAKQELSTFSDNMFNAFDVSKKGTVNAVELACGFTVLCGGRKSDKLEHVFDLLDEDKDSLLSFQDISRFIQSFLVVLMSISSSFTFLDGSACNNDKSTIGKAIEAGSDWATSQVFEALKPSNGTICFDDFADWYTKGGYQSIPWLELLDLRKWVLQES